MNRSALAFCLGFPLALGVPMSVDARDGYLASLKWKNRVLVVVAPSPHDDNLMAQRRIFQQNGGGMNERQIVLVEAAASDPRAREIRGQFSVEDKQFKVVLLGKDGNVALTSGKPLTAEKLFATIDAMPMRKDEMRRDRK